MQVYYCNLILIYRANSIGNSNKVIIVNLRTQQKILEIDNDTQYVFTIEFSKRSNMLACGGSDKAIKIYQLEIEVIDDII